jgi:hypothetical protein
LFSFALSLVPLLIATFYLQLLIHGLGHAVSGEIAGLRLQRFNLGPLCWIYLADGWRLRWMPEFGYFRGSVAAAPRDTNSLRFRLMMFFGGGALAKVLSLLLAVGLSFTANSLISGRWETLAGAWALAAMIELTISIARPRKEEPPLRNLLRGGDAAEQCCLRSLPMMSWVTPVRPAQWQPEWTGTPIESYVRHLDRNEIAAAVASLNESIETQLQGVRGRLVVLEAAYFSARHTGDAVRARQWLSRQRTGFPVEHFVELRAEAAVLIAEGRCFEAAQRAAEGLRRAQACESSGWTEMNLRLLRDLESELAARRG